MNEHKKRRPNSTWEDEEEPAKESKWEASEWEVKASICSVLVIKERTYFQEKRMPAVSTGFF